MIHLDIYKTLSPIYNINNSKENSYKYQDSYTLSAGLIFLGANDYNNIKNPTTANFVAAYKEMLRQIIRD